MEQLLTRIFSSRESLSNECTSPRRGKSSDRFFASISRFFSLWIRIRTALWVGGYVCVWGVCVCVGGVVVYVCVCGVVVCVWGVCAWVK